MHKSKVDMIFKYTKFELDKPILSLDNATHRFVPRIEVKISGPDRSIFQTATLDTGAVDTVFPSWIASHVGIDLAGVAKQEATGVGGRKISYQFAKVQLMISDHNEKMAWDAVVGFAEPIVDPQINEAQDLDPKINESQPKVNEKHIRPLLGHTGMMNFFNVQFIGDSKHILIYPNRNFKGIYEFR